MDAIRIEGMHKHLAPSTRWMPRPDNRRPGTVFGFLGPNGRRQDDDTAASHRLARATAGRPGLWVWRSAGARRASTMVTSPTSRPTTLDECARVPGGLCGPIFDIKPAEARSGPMSSWPGRPGRRGQAPYRRLFPRHETAAGRGPGAAASPTLAPPGRAGERAGPLGRHEVLEFIQNLRGQVTLLMSTHILNDVERVCDTVGIIDKGKMVVQAGATSSWPAMANRSSRSSSRPRRTRWWPGPAPCGTR